MKINMKNNLFGKHLVTTESFCEEDIELIFSRTWEMTKLVQTRGGDDRLKGKV